LWVYVDPIIRQVVNIYIRKNSYVNSRITLAIFVAFGMVMTFSINPLQQQIQQNAFAQDDESDTDTEQRLRQKNLGSGESTNFNCAENLITSASDSIECIPSGPAPPTPPQTGAFTVSGQGSGTPHML
jgi:hypothetical protein